jgi:hypothetical protein
MADSPVTFLLTSVVRSKENRAQRWLQPGRVSWAQKLAGGSITVRRARPARITEAALIANIEEIKRAVAAHQIVVTTPSGQVLDLATLSLAPAAPSKAQPNPPLDSAKNDANQNIGYDVPPTPEGTTMGAPEPELLKTSALYEPEPPAETIPDLPPVILPSLVSPEAQAEADYVASETDEEEETTPGTSPSTAPAAHHKKSGKKGRR